MMPVKVLASIDRLPEPVRRFLDRLSPEEKLLLVLKRELYDGDWRPMVMDLRNRLEGRPYVVRLASRIEDDLARIERIRQLEERHDLDLSEHVLATQETESTV
jgi:hypothetical protein